MRTEEWEQLGARDRYLAVVRGYALSRREQPVLSHDSAAVAWGLPHVGPQPHEVHIANDDPRGGRARAGVRAHLMRLEPDDVTTVDGVLVTSLRRTIVDLAATASVMTAVSAIDHVLHVDRRGVARTEVTREELLELLGAALPLRGSVRALARIEFGESGAANAGESTSRVTLAHIGAPAPILQRTFVTELGEFDTDFYFEEADTAAELDGKQKYLDPAFRSGRSAERVVYDEKLREDAIRRRVRAFLRWGMAAGMNRDTLRTLLVSVGVPVGRARPRIS
ncbi:hypothetical protein [Protaetiibacter intestinalis]|uniref:AbiEi antitoxin C-terminal domain-containing protein n=1 Tax=Protaetiibacter intestinalis TaxID=2419774 RepID=A0A387B225_9MICO|nr:hypothetical protein [Protaetiibacter intestinalis]AYF97564.1 hypothetical protein D7I47_04340 [Protaetiibacter intestinalis]